MVGLLQALGLRRPGRQAVVRIAGVFPRLQEGVVRQRLRDRGGFRDLALDVVADRADLGRQFAADDAFAHLRTGHRDRQRGRNGDEYEQAHTHAEHELGADAEMTEVHGCEIDLWKGILSVIRDELDDVCN
jgi:hypothetical protein